MTMTVGKDEKNPGKFAFVIHSGFNDVVEFGGNYPTMAECNSAAKLAYRAFHASNFAVPSMPVEANYMSLDDIFAELEA